MTQQRYTGVDAVFIQLGINDLISSSIEDFSGNNIIEYIDEMVSSVKSYSNSVKIVINMVIPPNSDGSTFAAKYHGLQSEFIYRYNTLRYNQLLTDRYREDNRVTILGINTELDTNVDIWDGVHPDTSGHQKIARTIYNYLTNHIEVQ